MDFEAIGESLSMKQITETFRQYESFGPLLGILLPFLEAFLPFLPLFVIVMANANAFGLWPGFFYSWLGACAGAFLVFAIARKIGQKSKVASFFVKHPQIQKWMGWIERNGFGPLFLLFCFPFTPSAIINIVAGLSRMGTIKYMAAVFAGKLLMIFTLSFVGHDFHTLLSNPTRAVLVVISFFILWYAGKKMEGNLNKSVKRRT